jgi:nucleoside-diphosphate-sugar epimerase
MPAALPLGPADRVLVTGASGWLGRSLMARLLPESSRLGFEVHGVAGSSRAVRCTGTSFDVESWDDGAVAAWSPTVLVHAAFVTRDHLDHVPEPEFEERNRSLTSRALRVASLPSIRSVVHVSSGAAVAEEPDVYGRLKREQEQRFAEVAVPGGPAVVNARVWSVSGPCCPKPDAFAFVSFVRDALTTGSIHVHAQGEVWRRYVDAGEFMDLALLAAIDGRTMTIDSTGDLVELHDLAARVASILGATVTSSPPADGIPPSRYHSDSDVMAGLASEWARPLSGLADQIVRTSGDWHRQPSVNHAS